MLGNHLPNNGLRTQLFYYNGTTQQWIKPPGAKLIHIICIGGGGGGGGGYNRATAVNGGGGGGGGSTGISRMTIDASLCPDYLEVGTGKGGNGGAAGVIGSAGGGSAVYIPFMGIRTGTDGILCLAGGGGAGGAGTSAVGGAAGAAAVISVSTTFSTLGVFTGIAGQAGTLGGYNITTPLAVAWGTLFISGGAGGAGITSTGVQMAGGNITQATAPLFQTITGGAIGGGRGKDGLNLMNPLPIFTGGSGGGSGTTGGRGGNGGFGSGGGGGAAGAPTGGIGGNGGDGLVIISYV